EAYFLQNLPHADPLPSGICLACCRHLAGIMRGFVTERSAGKMPAAPSASLPSTAKQILMSGRSVTNNFGIRARVLPPLHLRFDSTRQTSSVVSPKAGGYTPSLAPRPRPI